MKIEYAVIGSSEINKLVDYVNKALSEGWKLQGGVSTSDRTTYYSENTSIGGDSDFYLAQALYREVPDLTPPQPVSQSPSSVQLPTTPVSPASPSADHPA